MIDLVVRHRRQPAPFAADRIDSAGLVIRRIPIDARTRSGRRAHRHDQHAGGVDAEAPDGTFGWVRLKRPSEDARSRSRAPAVAVQRTAGARSPAERASAAVGARPRPSARRSSRRLTSASVSAGRSSSRRFRPRAAMSATSRWSRSTTATDRSGRTCRRCCSREPIRARTPAMPSTTDYMSADYCRQHGATRLSRIFVNLLQVVAIEFSAFDGTAAVNGSSQALNRRSVTFSNGRHVGVGDFLATANARAARAAVRPATDRSLLPVDWDASTRRRRSRGARRGAELSDAPAARASSPPRAATRITRVSTSCALFLRVTRDTTTVRLAPSGASTATPSRSRRGTKRPAWSVRPCRCRGRPRPSSRPPSPTSRSSCRITLMNAIQGVEPWRARQGQRPVRRARPLVDLQLQHPDHHDLRVLRAQHFSVAAEHRVFLAAVRQDLHPDPVGGGAESRRRIMTDRASRSGELAVAAAAGRTASSPTRRSSRACATRCASS